MTSLPGPGAVARGGARRRRRVVPAHAAARGRAAREAAHARAGAHEASAAPGKAPVLCLGLLSPATGRSVHPPAPHHTLLRPVRNASRRHNDARSGKRTG